MILGGTVKAALQLSFLYQKVFELPSELAPEAAKSREGKIKEFLHRHEYNILLQVISDKSYPFPCLFSLI